VAQATVILRSMHANSRFIRTAQTGVHAQLGRLLDRHTASIFRKPFSRYNVEAFDASMAAWRSAGAAPLILDAGCGVGLSTHHLALQFPQHFVIGVDQSEDRLQRQLDWPAAPPSNLLLVRADLVDYWRLLHAHQVRLARQYVLYPNPWPKIGQLARRWHAHPVFPTVVALGGVFECRSNWQVYVDECAYALQHLTGRTVTASAYAPAESITPFERKYLASGHGLWRCMTTLADDSSAGALA
jgi:tRNA (guanine-N7-)-methyltransferase